MHKTWILIILLGIALFSGCVVPKAEAKIEEGKLLFSSKGCATCHKIQSTGKGKGIDLTNVGSRLDSTAIKNKIKVCMPKLNISAKDTEALAVYLSTLKLTAAPLSKEQPVSTPTTTTVDIKWKGSVAEADIVRVVNFLINNKGKEIEFAGGKHKITGKEKLDVQIIVSPCCDEEAFRKYISTFGVVKDVKFPTFYATVPANAIQKLDKRGDIVKIEFESKAQDFWMKVIEKYEKKR